MKYNWKIVFLTFAAFLLAVQLKAQIKNEQVEVVKDYEASIADAVKESFTAVPAPIDSLMKPLEYSVKLHLLHLAFRPDEIKPLAMPKQEEPVVMKRLIKAGFGTQWSPLAEAYISNGRSDQFNYGLSFQHISSNGNLRHQNFSDNHAKLFGNTYFNSVQFGSEIFYNREVINFYGYDHQDTAAEIDSMNLKQAWQQLGLRLNFGKSKKPKNGFNYSVNLLFNHLSKNPKDTFPNDISENYFGIETFLKKEIADHHVIHLDMNFMNRQLKNQSDTSASLFSVIPYYEYKKDRFRIQAGFNFTGGSEQLKVIPNLFTSYDLTDDYAVLYAGYKGSRTPILLSEVYKENPFIGNFTAVSSLATEFYAGVKGSYGNNITFGLRAAYQSIGNYSLYLPDTSLLVPTVYSVIPYDAKIFNLHAEVGYKQAERINVILSGDFNSFDLDFNDEPWGIPKNKLQLSGNYNIQDKIVVQADIFASSGSFTIVPGDTQQKQLDGILDLNLSVTYNYKPNVSFFAMLNNIAAAKYQRYYQYPSYGFQALAGAVLKF